MKKAKPPLVFMSSLKGKCSQDFFERFCVRVPEAVADCFRCSGCGNFIVKILPNRYACEKPFCGGVVYTAGLYERLFIGNLMPTKCSVNDLLDEVYPPIDSLRG